MDGDILYPDGTPIVIEGAETTLAKWDGLAWTSESKTAFCTIHDDGTYSINPNLTAEQYKQALGMVIDYFTKGK